MATKKTSTTKTVRSTRAKTPVSKVTANPVKTRKPATPVAKTMAPPAAVKAKPVPAAKPAVSGVTLAQTGPAADAVTKKVFFERVKARANGVKGRDVRAVMDAVLAELGDALSAGDMLKIQPMGTMKVQRRKQLGGAELVVCKLRRKKPAPDGKDPLAEAAE